MSECHSESAAPNLPTENAKLLANRKLYCLENGLLDEKYYGEKRKYKLQYLKCWVTCHSRCTRKEESRPRDIFELQSFNQSYRFFLCQYRIRHSLFPVTLSIFPKSISRFCRTVLSYTVFTIYVRYLVLVPTGNVLNFTMNLPVGAS